MTQNERTQITTTEQAAKWMLDNPDQILHLNDGRGLWAVKWRSDLQAFVSDWAYDERDPSYSPVFTAPFDFLYIDKSVEWSLPAGVNNG